MTRTLSEATITTPKARSNLKRGAHWRALDQEVHLGYRRGARGGTWLVRWYVGNQKYKQEAIGTADDVFEADGEGVLSFYQAQSAARKLVQDRRLQARAAENGAPATVRSAIEAYIEARADTAGDSAQRDTRQRLTKHVMGAAIADKALFGLSEKDLKDWRRSLPASLASSTRTRITNDVKAALNAAAREGRANLPAELPLIIKNGLASEKPQPAKPRDGHALSDDQIRRILQAARSFDDADGWEGDLYRMVLVLATTGARFSQVARMRVLDAQPEQGRLMIPVSRKGRGEKISSHLAIHVADDVLQALLPVTVGRRGNEPLLERWYHEQGPMVEGKPVWKRTERAAWRSPSLLVRPWNAIIDRAGFDRETVVPYSLRHSSIVRMLRSRLPVRLVAALHDTSSAIIEKHYAASIIDALGDMTATAALSLNNEPASVTRLPLANRQA